MILVWCSKTTISSTRYRLHSFLHVTACLFALEFARVMLQLNLSVDDSKQLRDALVLDSLFLRDHDIMDYSLLIGVRHQRLRLTREAVMTDLQRTPSSTMQDQKSSREDAPMFGHGLSSGEVFHKAAFGGMMPESWEPPVVFYLGVIDMLQRWDVSKRLERAAKLILCRDGDGLSAIEPHAYQKRFEEQVINVVTYVPTAASVHTPNAV
jgi:1-phosphatidylinositol-4-phosphate 5-kinase